MNYQMPNYYQYQMPQQIQPQYQNEYRQSYPLQSVVGNLAGRIVENITEVNANEVPMDGTKAIFVKRDGTKVWTKEWTPNGNIATREYAMITDAEPLKEVNLQDDIIARLERIEDCLMKPKKPTRKDGADNES